ncbi:MAG: hypothetical protein KF788_16965 [Piscinibacter sp.]|nr:hypothetical protein [Piscinibacter sp.]
MLLRRAPLAALALAACALAAAGEPGDGWVERAHDAATGTTVYLRDLGPERFPAFLAIARWPVRVAALTAVLLDTEHMPEWVYRTRRVEPLAPPAGRSGVSRVISSFPWPLSDRDAVVAWRLEVDTARGAVAIIGESAPDRVPPDPALVRMPSFASSWRFTPLADGQVEVRFEGQGNPGGALDSALLRGFVAATVWEAPLQTMVGLRAMVERPAYRDATLPAVLPESVREPPR